MLGHVLRLPHAGGRSLLLLKYAGYSVPALRVEGATVLEHMGKETRAEWDGLMPAAKMRQATWGPVRAACFAAVLSVFPRCPVNPRPLFPCSAVFVLRFLHDCAMLRGAAPCRNAPRRATAECAVPRHDAGGCPALRHAPPALAAAQKNPSVRHLGAGLLGHTDRGTVPITRALSRPLSGVPAQRDCDME
jgi:hypothetical protein